MSGRTKAKSRILSAVHGEICMTSDFDRQYASATRRERKLAAVEPRAVSAHYDRPHAANRRRTAERRRPGVSG